MGEADRERTQMQLVKEEAARRASHVGHTVLQQEIKADYEKTQEAMAELQSELAAQRASHDAHVLEQKRQLMEKSTARSSCRAVHGSEGDRTLNEHVNKVATTRANHANRMSTRQEVTVELGRSETQSARRGSHDARSMGQHMGGEFLSGGSELSPAHQLSSSAPSRPPISQHEQQQVVPHNLRRSFAMQGSTQPATPQESTEQPYSHQSSAGAPARDRINTIATIARFKPRLRKGRRLANKHGMAQANGMQQELEKFVKANANVPEKHLSEVGEGDDEDGGGSAHGEIWCNDAQEGSDN